MTIALGFSMSSFAQQMGTVEFTQPTVTVDEANASIECNASSGNDLNVLAIQVDPAAAIDIVVSGGTATEGEDFEILNGSFMVEGTGTTTFQFIVFNDALVEGDETAELSFDFDGMTQTMVITIADEDVVPVVGNMTMELLNEGFDTSATPDGWSIIDGIDTGLNSWAFNGTGLAAGVAYITDGSAPVPNYEGNNGSDPVAMDASSNALLLSPEISSAGLKDVNVSFDWMAGGERDTDNAENLFDYGQFVYTIDGGSSFIPVENYVGTIESLGATPASGTYDMIIPELTNTTFQVGFRWLNDQLIGTGFSFTIDNVLVTAQPLGVELADTGSDVERVRAGNDIYFVSDQNTDIMARIENPSEDSGCVEVSVTSAGSATIVNNSSAGFDRGSKVIQITSDDDNAVAISYDLTLYFTPDEVSGFTDVSSLQLVRVDGTDIDATTTDNFTVTGGLFEDNSENGFLTYKGTFTGYNGVFAIVQDATQGVSDLTAAGISIFPNSIRSGEMLNVVSSNSVELEALTITNLNGAVVKSTSLNGTASAQVSTAGLSTGIYFVSLNGDKSLTTKLIVK